MVFTAEELNGWKVEDLRKFLLDRGVPLSAGNCRKAQLIEKVILAEKLELPILPSGERRQEEISQKRIEKLTVDGVIIPFPENLNCGWFEGSQYFPELTLNVISTYASNTSSMKAFREGKNLQFSGHVKSICFHIITESIKFCFVKAKVIPQTRISEEPYSVWVCLRKDCSSILTAECTCVAGYSCSCKHVFALLHFIENEVKYGRNKSCTSKKKSWGISVSKKGERVHLPCQLSAVNFKRPHPENDDLVLPNSSRQMYEPRSRGDVNLTFSQADWEEVAEATNGTASVLQFKIMSSAGTSSPSVPPPTILEIVDKSTATSLLSNLKTSRTSYCIEEIEELTVKQSSSEDWFRYRQGVITASVAHEVLRKVHITNTGNFEIANLSSANHLCAKICGYNKSVSSKSLLWGRSNEEYARKRYIRKTRSSHKNFSCKLSGLFLSKDFPCLGASPDALVNCSCCGFGVVEIKCPFTSRDKTISEYILTPASFLSQDGETVVIKTNHPYNTQVQHQMFVTGASYCDFEIFLPKESTTIRIKKDPNYGSECVPKLLFYFDSIITPELFSNVIFNECACRDVLNSIVKNVVEKINQERVLGELHQLSQLNACLPVHCQSLLPVKRKSSNMLPESLKKSC